MDESHYKALYQTITERCNFIRTVVATKHRAKLSKPVAVQEEDIQKKWVVNVLDRDLNKDEIALLRKGLNFAIMPQQVPTKEIIALIESAIDGLMEDNKDEIRADVYSCLKQTKPPCKQNLTREERDNDILVLKADKGNCTVVMNSADYYNQVREMLGD